VCHHGHRVHPDDRRHHRDDRRNRRHHRDDRRNRRHRQVRQDHPRRHRDDREHHRERGAHPGDRQPRDRASCPGSGAAHLVGDHRNRREPPGDHPAGGASPGWEQTGCCPDGQPKAPRGPHGLREPRGPRGRSEACPGWVRTGCSPGEGLRGAVRDAGHRCRPRGLRAPGDRALRRPVPWVPVPWVQAPGVQVPPVGKERERRPSLRPERGRKAHPVLLERLPGLQQVLQERPPRLQPGRRQGQGAQERRAQARPAWHSASWGQASARRPCHPLRSRRWQHAVRGRTREPCGPRVARWSKKPTGRTRPVLSDD
jgi:hypothetical protein